MSSQNCLSEQNIWKEHLELGDFLIKSCFIMSMIITTTNSKNSIHYAFM